MQNIVWTRHAKNRMRLYEISDSEVLEALESPTTVLSAERGKVHAFKKIHNRILRVTFKDEDDKRVVITVTPKSRFPEGR